MILKNPASTAMTSKTPRLNKARARSYAITTDVPKDLKKDITSNDKPFRKTAFVSPCTYCEGNLTHLNIVNRCTANPSMNDWMFSRTIDTAMDASGLVMCAKIVAIKLTVLHAKGDIHQYYM